MSSILVDTKAVLGISDDYTAFDTDIIMHINAAFSVINQLGVGPDEGYFIEDKTTTWDSLGLPRKWTNLVKTYMYLKVRMLFDPPTMSYLVEAMKSQLEEYEWRLNNFREIEEAS